MNSINGKTWVFSLVVLSLVRPIFLGAAPVSIQRHTSNEGCVEAQLFLDIEHKVALVGELVPGTIRLLFDPQRVDFQSISFDEAFEKNWKMGACSGPEKKRVGEKGFVELTWHVQLIPLTVGEHQLPTFFVDVLAHDVRDFGGFFTGFFSSRSTKRLKTPQKIMRINALPIKEACVGVGLYTRAQLEADRLTVLQGDAIELTCRLWGQGSAGFFEAPVPLLPAQAVVHSAKAKRGDGFVDFSFVVQVMESGQILVPAQKIVLYDPMKKQSYSLLSNTLTLSVEARAFNKEEKTFFEDEKSDVEELAEGGSSSYYSCKPAFIRLVELPLWMLIFFIVLVLLGGCSVKIYPLAKPYWEKFITYCSWVVMYILITWRAWRAKATAEELYAYFEKYPPHLSAVKDEQWAWESFWAHLLASRFSSKKAANRALCQEARRWLLRIRKMRTLIIGSILLVSFQGLCAEEVQKAAAEKMGELRGLQATSSAGEFSAIEASIKALREHNGGDPEGPNRWSKGELVVLKLIHLLPFVIWQLLLVVGLIAFFLRPRIWYALWVVISLLATAMNYGERHDQWLILEKETKVYLGPGVEYPTRCVLPPLGEVQVKERKLSQDTWWLRVDCVVCSGWIISPKVF